MTNKDKLNNIVKCCICSKKKVIIMKCSYCDKYYCIKHRMPEIHNCKNNINDISSKNTLNKEVIICEKVNKI